MIVSPCIECVNPSILRNKSVFSIWVLAGSRKVTVLRLKKPFANTPLLGSKLSAFQASTSIPQ